MSFEVISILTDEARRRTSEGWEIGKSFRVTSFVIGDQGHDPSDTTIALVPDPSSTVCPGNIFGPKTVAGFTNGNDFCPIWECFLDYGEVVAQFSSLCLIAQIVYSPIPGDPELNSTFLFSVATFPLRAKTDLEQVTFRVGVQR
jgi:hypothetical protein